MLEKVASIDARDGAGDIPLHTAIASGNIDALSILLDAADKKPDGAKYKNTLLHYAFRCSKVEENCKSLASY